MHAQVRPVVQKMEHMHAQSRPQSIQKKERVHAHTRPIFTKEV